MLHFQRWKVILVIGVVLAGIVFAFPNLFPSAQVAAWPVWLPHKQINLGLDLQGGAHLLYQMDEKEMVDDWLNDIRGEAREKLRTARIGYIDLIQNAASRTVSVKIRDAADAQKAYDQLRPISLPIGGSVLSGFTGRTLDVEEAADNSITLTITDAGLTQRLNSAIEASINTIRRRVDAFGTTEPSIQRQGRNRILVQVPGVTDVERLKDLIGKTGKLEFKLVDTGANAQQAAQSKHAPSGDELHFSAENPPIPYVLHDTAMVSGANLVDAQPGFDQRSGEPIVTFRFDTQGAKRFASVTQNNVGLPFAIVLDDKVISAPVIREPILGGAGQISGHFDVQGANDLSVLLRSGALPAKLTVIEERTVGASLGADSIAAGKKAALIGLSMVVIFMFAAYGLFGLFANIALLLNIALTFGVLSLIGSTLTLPGIAGIVLTMGIAVDANVLINERIREEIRSGKSPFSSIEAGYKRAMSTIVDSNVTTLISTLVLFWLGSGPVRGFAVTLSIGIIVSMFTAVTVTRLMVYYWLRWTRPVLVPI